MNTYRGHLWLAVSILLLLASAWCAWLYFTTPRQGDDTVLLFLVAAVAAAMLCLLTIGWAYLSWVPKWEREERRTGRVPGGELRRP